MPIKNKQIIRIGHSWGFLVPKAYIKDGLLREGETYIIEIKRASDNSPVVYWLIENSPVGMKISI